MKTQPMSQANHYPNIPFRIKWPDPGLPGQDSISLAHLSLSSGLNFQGAKLFSILLDIAFHSCGALLSSIISERRSSTMISRGGDRYRTLLHTGLAGSTRPEFFYGNIIMKQFFVVVLEFAIQVDVFSHFFCTIPCVHHDLAWRQQFAGLSSGTGSAASATLGTTVCIQ